MQPYNFEPACWATDKDGLDNINECPLGLLSFDGQNAPRLNILRGHLVSESVPMENGGNAFALDFSRKSVFGYSNDNKYYILRDVHGTNAIPFSQTFIQQKLQGESIIVANQRIDYNPSISELTVNLSGFSEWIRTRFSRESYETTKGGNHELKFTYAPEDAHDILLYKSDSFEVYARHCIKTGNIPNVLNEFSFRETWRLNFKIMKSEGMPLDDILNNLFEPFERLLTFCMGFPGNIEEITFTGVNPAVQGQYFDRYVPGEEDEVGRLAVNMPLLYPEISNRFQDIADNWMNATGDVQTACRTGAALLGKWDKAIDVMFSLCAQSFEATSRVGENLSELSDEEFERRKTCVLETINNKTIYNWAELKLTYANFVSAGELANRLWTRLGDFANYVVPNKKLFLRQHRESRNTYTHMREPNNDNFLTGSDLYWHARAVQVLQYGAVLLYLGFQPTEILSIFQKHNFMTSFISQAQDIYAQVEQQDDDAK